ncbi:hypothetical protein D4R51_00220, partial [bacterium]
FDVTIVDPTCTRSAPTSTVIGVADAIAASPGDSRVFPIIFRNLDSIACAGSDFTVSVNTPAGWTTSVLPNAIGISLNPDETGAKSIQVDVPVTAALGNYEIAVTVKNNGSGKTAENKIKYSIAPSGDVDDDGVISCADVDLIMNATVGNLILTAGQQKRADVSGDGTISAYDVSLLLQRNKLACLTTASGNAITSVMGDIVDGGFVGIPQTGFGSANVSAGTAVDALPPVPVGIINGFIMFKIPSLVSPDYYINTSVNKGGTSKVEKFRKSQVQSDEEEASKICTSRGAKRCSASEDGSQGFQECVRDSNPSSDTFKNYIWKGTECASNEMCKAGSCVPIEDLSDYSPKIYGPASPLTITIDVEAIKLKKNITDLEPPFLLSLRNDKGENIKNKVQLSETTVNGKKVWQGVFVPDFAIWNGPAFAWPGDYKAQLETAGGQGPVVNDVLKITVPDAKCSLVWGNGNQSNLDMVFVGDFPNDTSWRNLRSFYEYLHNVGLYNMADLDEFDVLSVYSPKINVWVANVDDLGCRATDITDGYYAGDKTLDCDSKKVDDAAALCPSADLKLAVSKVIANVSHGQWSSPSVTAAKFAETFIKVFFTPSGLIDFLDKSFINRYDVVDGLKSGYIYLAGEASHRLLIHELGHSLVGLLDYYFIDPVCANHPSLMCSIGRLLSDEKLSNDKYFYVKELNKKYCDGVIEISRPYPNDDYFPMPGADKSCIASCTNSAPDCSLFCRTLHVQVRAKYPSAGESCYATMDVTDINGRVLRKFASKDPILSENYDEFRVPSKNYVFEWDGKDKFGNLLPTGTYLLRIGMRDILTKNTQNGSGLKVLLVK